MLLGKAGKPDRTGEDNKQFFDAVHQVACVGSPWRDLPPAFGSWNIVFKRRGRWHSTGDAENGAQAIGRSRGALSTKTHTAADALGYPLRLRLTAGQIDEIKRYPKLIACIQTNAIVPDTDYDADALVRLL